MTIKMRYYGYMVVVLLVWGFSVHAQAPTYGLGAVPTEAEIEAANTLVDTDGKLMPEGQGTAKQGATLFAQRCAMCHGPNGEGTKTHAGIGPVLVAQDKQSTDAIRGYHFATTLFSYIRRAMPMHQERTLSIDDSYSLSAFLLFRNGIIGENEVMNAKSLPQVKMPNRDDWSPPDEATSY